MIKTLKSLSFLIAVGHFSQKLYPPSREFLNMITIRYEPLDRLDSIPPASEAKKETKGSDVQQGNQSSGLML